MDWVIVQLTSSVRVKLTVHVWYRNHMEIVYSLVIVKGIDGAVMVIVEVKTTADYYIVIR